MKGPDTASVAGNECAVTQIEPLAIGTKENVSGGCDERYNGLQLGDFLVQFLAGIGFEHRECEFHTSVVCLARAALHYSDPPAVGAENDRRIKKVAGDWAGMKFAASRRVDNGQVNAWRVIRRGRRY